MKALTIWSAADSAAVSTKFRGEPATYPAGLRICLPSPGRYAPDGRAIASILHVDGA